MGYRIIIRGSPLFGYPVLLLLSVTLLCYCDNVLEVTFFFQPKNPHIVLTAFPVNLCRVEYTGKIIGQTHRISYIDYWMQLLVKSVQTIIS